MKDFVFVEKYRKIVNEAKLKGCEDILCGDMLYYTLWLLKDNKISLVQFLMNCLRIIMRTFFTRNEFVLNGKEPKTLFLFSSSYCREDLKKNFMKAANLVPNRLDMLSGSKRKFLGFSFIKYLFYVVNWNKVLKKQIPDLYLRTLVLCVIYNSFIDYKIYEKYTNKHNLIITNLVSNCDTHAIDCFFTQKFNLEKHTTVTLQHGTFSSNIRTWDFEGIKSDYFICHNWFTVDEARKTLFNKKIIPAGVLSYINVSQPVCPDSIKVRNIGIFLDGERVREENIIIIKFICNYFKNSNYNLLFKFHPVSKIETYREYLNNDNKTKFFGKEVSILDFSKKIDLAIVGGSTVLIELLQSWIPVLIIHTKEQKYDVFNSPKCLRFSNEEELTRYLNMVETEGFLSKLKEMRDYFCTNADIAENYINAFRKIGIIK